MIDLYSYSTNLEQLSYTVKGYYGQDFNAYHYLEKMFDYQIDLNKIEYNNYLEYLGIYSTDIFGSIITEMSKYYNFSLRQCNKYVQQGKLIRDYIHNKNSFDYRYNRILNILIPMLLAIKIHDIMKYSQIINGKGKQDFINCINDNLYVKNLILQVANDSNAERDEDLNNQVIVSLYEELFCNNQYDNKLWTRILDYNPKVVCELLTLASKKINYKAKELAAK